MHSVYNHEGDDLFFFTAAGKGDNRDSSLLRYLFFGLLEDAKGLKLRLN